MTSRAIALLLGAVAAFLAALQPISDTDLWWHLATGRETLAHGIVRTDLFSWTVRGAPVSTDQWLGQVLLYASYALAGWSGIALMRVALVGALVAIVAFDASSRPLRPLALVLATLPAILLTRAVAVDRPELMGFVLFALLLYLLRRGRAGARWALFAAVFVVGLWANVHGSFALGVVLTVLVCAEGALRDLAQRRVYVGVVLATLAITLATPAGIGAWTAPGSHFLSPPRDIQEWNVVDVRTPLGVAYVVVLGLVVACVFAGSRLDPSELVVLLPVLFLSLTAARQAPLLGIAAAPLFADRASSAIAWLVSRVGTTEALLTRGSSSVRRDGDPPRSLRAHGPLPLGALGRAAALVPSIAIALIAISFAPRTSDDRAYPFAAINSISKGDGTLARYEWGGWLIWNTPATAVFVDGRLTPYRGAVLNDYQTIIAARPGWREAVTRRGVRALLVAPSDPVAVRARELGWRVIASSDTFVLIAVP